MKQHQYNCIITEFSESEITDTERLLIAQSKTAMQKAYAPYSKFKVGAAVLLANGEMISGSNQENAAYPSGLCAERVAIFAAASRFPDERIVAVAITTSGKPTGPVAPCGACRQAMMEYETKQKDPIKILMSGLSGSIFISGSIENLLPLVFTLQP